MKKSLKYAIIFLLTSLVLVSCKNETKETHPNQFTLSGEIKGLEGHLFFKHPDKEYKKGTLPDTIKVINGKIQFSDTISKLTLIRASPSSQGPDKKLFKVPANGRGFFPVKCSYLMFYAFPGADIKVSGEATDFMNAYPEGDKFNDALAAINKLAFPNYNTVGNLAIANTSETDSIVILDNKEKSEAIAKKNINELISHIKNNPKSLGATWYLNDLLLRRQIDETQAEELFNGLSSNDLSEFEDYKIIATRVSGIKNTKEGFPVPSIKTTATLDGSEFNINSLRGKYVLIDFWGIWCGPCVKEMPEVKAFKEKYKDKLVVLGVNSGDTKENVQKFIDEHNYDWQQILSDKKNTSDNFVNRFNVQGFPTKLIIDPKGNIVKRFLGSGEEAFDLLEELLEK
ncbi:TlpA disulfide reductase family protein [Flavivirga abyssicola]|uniref:TlpA disulfide reductase family protein n=1 Tax=Flavivirga abyssicola TaxID=3063533 RepID=UPI0026E07214|nr:TlpA disulfide reductase family protein [Flavivirga sp. MEBiC07777]WVK12007.1 TlpA disulfide reductase family protein [Flavivirga sp. MEBiC07777]